MATIDAPAGNDIRRSYSGAMPAQIHEREEAALLALLRYVEPNVAVSDLRHIFDDERKAPSEILSEHVSRELVPQFSVDEFLALANSDLNAWRAAGISVVTPFSDRYPAQLRTVFDYPLFLFARGEVLDDLHSAAIVGSRNVSSQGLNFAKSLSAMLAEDRITVVSGLARGVDGAAHRAALDAGGRTVAIVGTGVNKYYPSEHRSLQDEVSRRGLLLSQFWPNSGASRQSFPMRNITMSAYSSVTVIAEASEASGTRIQARAAVRHARPLVITEEVATQTTWGAEFAGGGYDVTVVGTAGEAREQIRRILSRRDALAQTFETF